MTGNAEWMKATDPVAPVASSGIQGYAGIPYVGDFPPSYPDAPYPGQPWGLRPGRVDVKTFTSLPGVHLIKNPKPKVSTKRTQEVLEFGEIQEDWITTVEIGAVTLKFEKDGAFEEFVEILGNHLTVIQQATAPR